MENRSTPDPRLEETLMLLKKIWVVFLVGLYMASLYNEYIFPGFREGELSEGETILLNVQRVIFFGVMALGFLADLVQMRIDRKKAFLFLFASLVLSGLSTPIAMGQMKVLQFIFG